MSETPSNELKQILDEIEERANKATPGPWRYEPGGGHAYNRIVGAKSEQTNGWPERINDVGNASFTDRICENLGDDKLPYPSGNIAFIASARSDVPALVKALRMLWNEIQPYGVNRQQLETRLTAILNQGRK